MTSQRTEGLLAFARALLRADSFAELLRVARSEVLSAAGYGNVWLMIGDKEAPDELQLIEFEGQGSDTVRAVAPRLTVAGDAFLQELISGDQPVVIPDARTDPRTNKAIVEALQNRTLINIPLRLLQKPFGLFGTGTFGAEGCRAPSDAELDYLVSMAGQIAIAASRIMLQQSRAREAHELRYRMLFENLNAAFAYQRVIYEGAAPVDCVFLEINSAFEQLAGLRREDIVGQRATRVLPGIRDFKPDLIAMFAQVVSSGEARHVEIDYTPQGRSYTIAVHSPAPEHIVSVFTDVTELRRRSQELERINSELESFSYSVSHDLRAPLRRIDGYTLLLLEDHADQLDDSGKSYLQRVRDSVQDMSELIDDLLDLSRVTRSELRCEPVDLSALARQVIEGLLEREPGRRVQCEVAPGLTARGDPSLLRQVLENLLGNAFKFTSHHPTAHIRFAQQQSASGPAFFVQDDGAGFDMKHAGKLFDPFMRLHAHEEFEGTGVGLAIVKRIIDRHGGHIWAQSAVEHGTTFHFTLGAP